MGMSLRNTVRLLKILNQHGLLRDALNARPLWQRLFHHNETKRLGLRMADALQDMGPTFIKLGQMLATRPDLVGDDIAHDLRSLQDRVPPFPTQ